MRPCLQRPLSLFFSKRGIKTINLSAKNWQSFKIEISQESLSLENPQGTIFKDSDILCTFSEGVMPHFSSLRAAFRWSEYNAAIAYLRMRLPNPINAPRGGSSGPFCGALSSQWIHVSRILNGNVAVPSLLGFEPSSPEGVKSIKIDNAYDYRFAPSHASPPSVKGMFVERPSGARLICNFVQELLFCVVDIGDQWKYVQLEGPLLANVEALLISLRRAYNLDTGHMECFYDGALRFWSVSPQLFIEILPDDVKSDSIRALSTLLVGKSLSNN